MCGTILLKAVFDNKDNAPLPGFVVINAVQLGVEKNALLSPRKSCNMAKTGCMS